MPQRRIEGSKEAKIKANIQLASLRIEMRSVSELYILYKQTEYVHYEIFGPVSPNFFNRHVLRRHFGEPFAERE